MLLLEIIHVKDLPWSCRPREKCKEKLGGGPLLAGVVPSCKEKFTSAPVQHFPLPSSSDTTGDAVALGPLRTRLPKLDGGGKVCRSEELASFFRQVRLSKGICLTLFV